MQIQRKALYNLLRVNWLDDPAIKAEAWQVDDYRNISLDELFHRLGKMGINLTRQSFLYYAANFDNPEDLTDCLVTDELEENFWDKVYLLVFEMWRRLVFDKPSLTVFCDELDFQISLYDQGHVEDIEGIQNVLVGLQDVLEDNVDDENREPVTLFKSVAENCANDVESFLYDFIADQIDEENYDYATELVDGFYDYISDVKWFKFLRIRLVSLTDSEWSENLLVQFMDEFSGSMNLDLLFDVLSCMVQNGSEEYFADTVRMVVKLLESESDFQDLLHIVLDFYGVLDMGSRESAVREVIRRRRGKDLEGVVNHNDEDVLFLLEMIKTPCSQA